MDGYQALQAIGRDEALYRYRVWGWVWLRRPRLI
jgi:hypothetical protein